MPRTDDRRPPDAQERSRRCRGDAGEVTSTVFVMPVVLTLILVVVQTALTWHAKTLVDAAASDAVVATQVEGGSEQAGQDAAADLLAGSTDQLLSDVDVEVTRTAETSNVRVQARVANVIPFIPVTVRATATGPTERFRSETE